MRLVSHLVINVQVPHDPEAPEIVPLGPVGVAFTASGASPTSNVGVDFSSPLSMMRSLNSHGSETNSIPDFGAGVQMVVLASDKNGSIPIQNTSSVQPINIIVQLNVELGLDPQVSFNAPFFSVGPQLMLMLDVRFDDVSFQGNINFHALSDYLLAVNPDLVTLQYTQTNRIVGGNRDLVSMRIGLCYSRPC